MSDPITPFPPPPPPKRLRSASPPAYSLNTFHTPTGSQKYIRGTKRKKILTDPVFFTSVLAGNPASTFILQADHDSSVRISVNVPSDASNDELYFHVSAPARQSWLGFGFGTEMKDALMFVAYTSENGNNVTLSPRIGRDHQEPKYTSAVGVTVLEGSYVDSLTYNINARCTDCRSWPLAPGERGSINVRSTVQPMIYAIGDESYFLHTDSQEAPIREHIASGLFSIDLQAATGNAGVPSDTGDQVGVVHEDDSGDGHLGPAFHGLIMGACFVVLFPVGGVLIRVPFRIAFWLHLIWQCCTLIGVITGFSLGIYVSIKNSRNPKLNSAHQGLGIALTLLVLIQPTLGLLHHRTYKKTRSPTLLGKIHRYLGSAIILVGIVNGALGLDFANDNGKLPAYFGFVLFISVICMLVQWILRRRTMRTRAVNTPAASNFREGAHDVPLQSYARQNQNNARQQSYATAQQPPPHYVNVMPKNELQRMS